MPIDDHIYGSPTFFQSGSQFKNGCISENALCMVGAVLGEPYSIFFEGRELVNNLTPQPDTANDYTGLGSSVELDLHIENSALRFLGADSYSPLGLLLLGVRQNNAGNTSALPYTNIVNARDAISKLCNRDLEILRGSNYLIHVPYRWRKSFANIGESTVPCPMISGEGSTLQTNAVFYPEMVTPLSNDAKIALDNFYNLLKSMIVKVNISPSKLVYIDNRFALHSRDKFTATYDEEGCSHRWIQRLFIMPNLWSLQNFSKVGSRVFNPN